MDQAEWELVGTQVQRLFSRAAGLSPAAVRELRRYGRRRALGLAGVRLRPELLQAVCAGRWTPRHDALLREVERSSRACAAGLCGWPGRRSIAHALQDAAVAVITDADPNHPLGDTLLARLEPAWSRCQPLRVLRRTAWATRPTQASAPAAGAAQGR